MFFQLIIFLYCYLGFLFLWLIFFLAGVYHMIKFGFKGLATMLVTFIFVIVAVGLLSLSYYYIKTIDWQTEIEIFSPLPWLEMPVD